MRRARHDANFSEQDGRSPYEKRAALAEFWLRSNGAAIDHTFSPRRTDRERIRAGVINALFAPGTETFHPVPAFSHLDRDRFEVVLLPCKTTQHPAEEHVKGLADRVIPLSGPLSAQVEQIRAENLDVALIGTNVTAVTHHASRGFSIRRTRPQRCHRFTSR